MKSQDPPVLSTGIPRKLSKGERALWGAVLARALRDLEAYEPTSLTYLRAVEYLVHQGNENTVGSLAYVASILTRSREEGEDLKQRLKELTNSPRGTITAKLKLLHNNNQVRYWPFPTIEDDPIF